VYIGVQGWDMRDQLLSWEARPHSILLIISAVIMYGIASVPLAFAWQHMLNRLSNQQSALLLLYARSQLGKYLPGNVAHLAGRHVMARDYDFPHSSLILSTLLEFAGLLSAAGTVILFATQLPSLATAIAAATSIPLDILGFALLCAMPFVAMAYRIAPYIFGSDSGRDSEHAKVPDLSVLLVPYFLYLCFFIAAGGAFTLVSLAISGDIAWSFAGLLFVTFAMGWTLGFVTPGAPSGIGIREAILFYILKTVFAEADALLISVLFRAITVAGDLLFWIAAELLNSKSKRSAKLSDRN
jgi:glycosyltransferase 2 family protein